MSRIPVVQISQATSRFKDELEAEDMADDIDRVRGVW